MSQTSTVVKSQRNCDVSSTNNGQESATQFFAPSWVPQTSELHSVLCTKLGSANIRTALNSLHQVGFRKHPNCTQFFAPSWVPQTSELQCVTFMFHKKKLRADIVSLADFKRSSTEVPRSSHPYTPFQLDLLLVQGVNLQCSRVGHLWHLRQRWHV